MSARPRLETMADEDLDLLLSRFLDDDLSPEDARELEAYLATNPGARNRRDALARVVKGLQSIPVHAESFGLATRVHAQVTEDATAFGSAWHRFGIYPPPGLAIAGAALVGLVVVGSLIFSGGPRREPAVASRQAPADAVVQSNEPVPVFFPEAEAKKAEKAEAQAKRQVPAKDGPTEADDTLASKDAKPVEQLASAESGKLREGVKAKGELAESAAPAASVPAKLADQAASGNETSTGQLAASERPAERKADSVVAYAPEPPGAAGGRAASAPAPPAAVARQAEDRRAQGLDADAKEERLSRRDASELTSKKVAAAKPAGLAVAPSWRVDVTTPGWRLVKSSPSPGGTIDATYRVQILASGQPGTIRLLKGDANPQAEAWIRTLILERQGDAPAGAEIEIRLRAP